MRWLAVLFLCACSGGAARPKDPEPTTCGEPGSVAPCPCDDLTGAKVCQEDGAFGPCVCEHPATLAARALVDDLCACETQECGLEAIEEGDEAIEEGRAERPLSEADQAALDAALAERAACADGLGLGSGKTP